MELYGVYDSTLFRNETTGYTILKIKLNEFIPEFDNIRVVCKGIFSYSLICLPLKLTGEKVTDKFGEFFEIETIEPQVKTKKEAIDFLSSSSFKGISTKTAKAIIAKTGADIFSLTNNPDAYVILTTIDGIGPNRAKTVLETLNKAKAQKEIFDYLSDYSVSFHSIENLIERYGINALEKIKKEPYTVGHYCGFPFLICDMIAKDNGVEGYDPARIRALVRTVMEKDYENGNVFISHERLINNINYISKRKSAFPDCKISFHQIISVASSLYGTLYKVKDDEIRFYFEKAYADEMRIAKNIKRLNRTKQFTSLNINKIINQCEEDLGIEYSKKQKECFNFLRSNGVKIITGGPGTGKSTVINGLTHAYSKLYPEKKIVMMAPTGRAAQRINEITGREAGTIHRMLNICPFDDYIQTGYFADYPADMIIVDESSMLDNELMAILAEGLKNNSLLIMVGDIDQLPSIGAGTVLKDLIAADVETVKLDVTYRQKGKSLIIENANKVNTGDSILSTDESFIIETCADSKNLAEKVKKTFLDLYDIKNPYSIQVLCPQLKGEAGIKQLNKSIQDSLKLGKNVATHYGVTFKKGDKVMATINNYDIGYFNGDIGMIVETNDLNFLVAFNKEIKTIPKENIVDFQLAYATTIHKSQGSEYEAIIICLSKEASGMMQRNLLYTAITRAKKKVYIFTEEECIETAVSTVSANSRKSSLKDCFAA